MGKRIERGGMTIQWMITLYQRRYPRTLAGNVHYQASNAYVDERLDKCVFGKSKLAYKQCPVHCYRLTEREEMKQITRWAGPRMLWRHPILITRHLLDDRRPVSVLPEKCQPKKQRPFPSQHGA